MVYKKFYFSIIIRVLFILISCLIVSYTILERSYLYTNTFLVILIILQIVLLIRYLNQSNSFLERFLIYLKDSNTTLDFSGSLNNSPFKDLSGYFEDINSIIQNAKIEKENQHQFLQYIFDHVNIGLIAFDNKLNVMLVNNATKKLLSIRSLTNLKSLNKIDNKLLKTIQNLKLNEIKTIPTSINDKNLHLSIKLSKFKLLEKELSLVSLQDIKTELDHKEIESWQKLNRVLTHEIMNSVSPIIGLTGNISKLLKTGDNIIQVDKLNQTTVDQTVQSINIIEERSLGLDNFVRKFRSITSTIIPEPTTINVFELFENLALLMHESFKTNDIKFNYTTKPESLEILADKRLIEQVLINLIKNSIEALNNINNKTIKINAYKNESDQKIIEVIDNGKGITPNELGLIFTPFYSTKENSSGIGLSLTKNILKQHGFHIDAWSQPNIKTIFTLYF